MLKLEYIDRFHAESTLYILGKEGDEIAANQKRYKFLVDLHKIKYLNSTRIGKLYGNYYVAMKRMRLMVKNGYVGIVDKTKNNENVYCISRKSCILLGLEYVNVGKTDKLEHCLACVDFYFSVKDKGIKNVEMERQYYFNHNGRKYSFRPDLVLEIDRWYLVEIDLCGRRFENKVKIWEGFYESGRYRDYFEKYPRWLL